MTMDRNLSDIAERFAGELSGILGTRLLSVYLFGSVTLDDYRDGWSDIDLIAFASGPLPQEAKDALLMIRQNLVQRENNPLFRKIEGAVVSADGFRNGRKTDAVYWGTSGQRITDSFSMDVFSMTELLKSGVLLFGTEIRDRWKLPSYSDLADGVKNHLASIRTYARETDERLYSCGWLLDIARCLYTLRYGDIISKTAAGEWALKEGLCPCPAEMEKTLTIRRNPAVFSEQPEIKAWLCSLGPAVQRFADVLEKECPF